MDQWHRQYVQRIAKGYNIHAVYNATHGGQADLKECKVGLKYTATTPVRLLHKLWNDFFATSSSDALLDYDPISDLGLLL